MSAAGIPAEKLVSIAIGIPGLIDYEQGRLRFADTLRGWSNQPLAERFTERYKVTTAIENDVKLVTLGEALAGAGNDIVNLICIWIGEGIGAGIVVDSNLHKGDAGSAGEIGYLEFSEFLANVPVPKYLYKGQKMVGQILSEAYLLEIINQHLSESHTYEELKEIGAGSDSKDRRIIYEILDEYAYYLSIICITFITTLNPKNIVLCGHVIEHFPWLIDKVQQLIDQKLKEFPFGECRVMPGILKDAAGLVGAVELALKSVFRSPITKKARIIEFE
jgi:predicted NBD/HSP70 family sugar kinase